MNRFFSIMIDEIKHFFKDNGAMLIMIGGVIAYSLFYAIPYYTEIIKEVPIGIIDFDKTNYSRSFIRDLNANDSLNITEQPLSIKDAEKNMYQDRIKGFVIIPKDFEKDILKGNQVNVSVYADSSYLIIYKAIYSGVMQCALSQGSKIEIGKMMISGIPKNQAISMTQPFEFIQIPLFNSIGGYKSYVYPIILILVLHQTLLVGLGLMQGTRNEKKERYCKKDEDIPITLFSRSTFYVILYLFYGIIAFLIYPNIFVYSMNYNILPMFFLYVLMLYACAFFIQSLSYLFRMRETAILVIIVTSLIFAFIPGFIFPRESIPDFVNIISFFIPATCGIDGIIKINQNGAVFFNVIYDFLWLSFLCLFYFISAVFLTKKLHKEFEQ